MANQSNQTLRKLRDRLSDIIEENESAGRAERNDAPVYFAFGLDRGRGDWYVPLGFVSGALLTFTDEAGDKISAITISGSESKAVKSYQRRARPAKKGGRR